MQKAVHDPSTAPMYKSDLQLSQAFDEAFAAAQQAARHGNPVPLAKIDTAARSAYAAIVKRWRTHVGLTNWVHFNNIAEWGTAYLDRAAGTEYIQYGDNAAAAGYWQAFVDGAGRARSGGTFPYAVSSTAAAFSTGRTTPRPRAAQAAVRQR
jgi:hypothetical protein